MHPYVRTALIVLLVCGGYYAGGLIGVSVRFPPSGVSIIWPATPVLLAALLLTPVRTWWVYLLAALPTHLHLATHFQPGVPMVTMLSQFAGNVLNAVLGALAVRQFVGAPPRLDDLRSMAVFILLAAIVAPAVASAVAVYLFLLTGWTSDYWLVWRQRFLTNVVGTITVAPLILVTIAGGPAAWLKTPLRHSMELGLLTVGLLAVGIPVFGWNVPGSGNFPGLLFAPLPLLLWAAVRLGPGALCFLLLVVALLSLSNAFAGRGPFTTLSAAENILSLQIFLIGISLPLMFLAALVEERRNKEEVLRRNEASLRASYAQIQSLVGRLITAQESERTRIARELHDDINQQLAALSIALSGLKRRLPADAADVDNALARLQQRTMTLADDIRHLSHELHPGVLQHAGLVAALKAHCAEFGSQHDIEVTLSVAAALDAIPQDIALCLYRVAQEALRNVAAHAGARQAHVALSRPADGLELTITDDGQGFDLAEVQRGGGLGLISLHERVHLVGGSVRIDTQRQRGTELRVQVPLGGQKDAPRDTTTRR
jgi:signal transduction histidine kinase